MINSRIGPYRLERIVGIGGMGSVHLAKRQQLGVTKWVALKTIHPHLAHDAGFVASFLDEAKIAAALTHPNVTQVFEFGKADNQFYLAMEYVHGETLAEIVNGGPLAPALAASIVSKAAEGLHHAHQLQDEHGKAMGLVHRDISPQNIFLSYEGHVKVSDFGIAWVRDRRVATQIGHVKGKLAYMPREQLHQETLDRRTDVFALGVVLWELLVGYGPFRAETDAQTVVRITQHEVHQPSEAGARVPAALDAIVMKAIAADREERYPTARAFSRALEEFLLTQQWRASPIELASEMAARFPVRRSEKEDWLHDRSNSAASAEESGHVFTPASFAHTAAAPKSSSQAKIAETSEFESKPSPHALNANTPPKPAESPPKDATIGSESETSQTTDIADTVDTADTADREPPEPKPVHGPETPLHSAAQRRSWRWLAGLALVLALAAAAIVWFDRPEEVAIAVPLESDRPPPPAPAAPAGGHERTMVAISISTAPPGATLELDGMQVGETPIQTLVAVGEHEVVLRLLGHEELVRTFDTAQDNHRFRYELIENPPEPTARRPRSSRSSRMAPGMEPASEMSATPAPAQLSLISNPWSAVKINGRRAGTTPFHNLEVPSGQVVIEYREQDQGEWHRLRLNLAPGERHRQRLP